MELQNTFNVPVNISDAWALLLDVERVAMCMPGATLDSVNGEEMTGRVKVKLGPIAMTYAGTARFVERNDVDHLLVLDAAGKDVRGAGGAKARMKMSLSEEGPSNTKCTVTTDLAVTGKPAQFGRGVMGDVSARLIGQFAQRLAEEVERPARQESIEYAVEAHGVAGVMSNSSAKQPHDDDDAIVLLQALDMKRLKGLVGPSAFVLAIVGGILLGLRLSQKERGGRA